MTRTQTGASGPMQELRRLALRLPGTEEGVACAGTALERRTIKVRGKAFLFLGAGDAMLKLGESLAAAAALAAKEPDRYRASDNGWVKVTFGAEGSRPSLRVALLAKWIEESHRLMAGTTPAKGAAEGTRPPRRRKVAKQTRPR